MDPPLSELGEAVLGELGAGWDFSLGIAEAFGVGGMQFISFSGPVAGPRVWAESESTWRLEFAIPDTGLTMATEWWLKPKGSDSALTEVLVAICSGDYALDKRDDLQVKVASKRMPITLPTFPAQP